MVVAEARGSIAARQAAGTLPWIGVNHSAEEQRLQADHAARLQESTNVQLGRPEKLTGAHDPQHALQKNRGLADLWYMDDGDVMCHPILVLSFLQEFDVDNAKVGAERNLQKTEVIHYVNDLDVAPPEWRIGRRAEHGKNLCSHRRPARSRCWVSAVHREPAPEQGRCRPRNARAR